MEDSKLQPSLPEHPRLGEDRSLRLTLGRRMNDGISDESENVGAIPGASPSAFLQMVALFRNRLQRGPLVVVAPDGGPIDYSHWRRRAWLPACEAAGVPGLHFHNLRVACGTTMVTTGVDVRTAQTRLGHADPRTTLAIYAQSTSAADRHAAERVGDTYLLQIGSCEAEDVG